MQQKTKIIATVGPATSTEAQITGIIKAGANVIRVNSSHGKPEDHKDRIQTIRKIAKSLDKHVAILLDLQGPKIRVGNIDNPIQLEKGSEVVIKPGDKTDGSFIPVDYAGIINDVKKGDKILLDDGKLALTVTSTNTTQVTAVVTHGGLLKARKGMNIPGSTASLAAVTERDIDFIKFGVKQKVDFIALSFVRDRDDILIAKHHIENCGSDIPVIAKIEKPQALENLSSIIKASDGIMVARGDLGIEISPENVPIVQKQIITEANQKGKIVIVATQMLESMIEQPIPTRAEASDVANAVMDGADAVMLSGETAVGEFPSETVAMMKLIAENVESSNMLSVNKLLAVPKGLKEEKDAYAISRAIMGIVQEVKIGAIIAFTKTGYTARLLSKAKPSVPIIAISDNVEVCRRLNLCGDVYPCLMPIKKGLSNELLKELDDKFISNSFLGPKDKVIITGSMPYLADGHTTNFIRLHEVGSL